MTETKSARPEGPPPEVFPGLPTAGGASPVPPSTMRVTVEMAIGQALQHYNGGRLPQAKRICAQILSSHPRRGEAHNLMGAILVAEGDLAGAAQAFRAALRIDARNPVMYANLGEVERKLGHLDEALSALREALRFDPRSPQANNNLGIVHFDRREFDDAKRHYEAALAADSRYPEAYNNLGNALRALGRNDEAIEAYQKALLYREHYPEAYNNLASVLADKKEIEEAEHCYRRAIEQKPGYLEAYDNLASLLVMDKRPAEALRVLAEPLKIDERHVPTLLLIAHTQLGLGNHTQAEQAARLAVRHDPSSGEGFLALGEILMDVDDFAGALEAFAEAVRLRPEFSEAHNLYGICLKSAGRLDEARAEFVRALEINPAAYGCYANLADLQSFKADDKHVLAMEAAIAKAEDERSPRYLALHFALGKAYDDIGEYGKAIRHFKIGAALKRALLDYDEGETLGFFESIRETFSAEFLASRPFPGNPSTVPIFIIGMPRSGSTLVEQVLASHPQTYGAGETKEFSRQLGLLRSRFPSLPKYPAIMRKMNADHYRIIADGYLRRVRAPAPSAERITDKLLTNFYFVGLLHVLFPNARFIHTKRNPVDTCWSGFTKLFKDDMPHSYDFAELARYYHKYEELMAHWEGVLPPGTIKTVIYEEVVDRLEATAREIVDFVGLPWDPAVLAFHESPRPVKTASVVQVRQPVYRTSLERWRRYGDEIQPLVDALGYRPAP